MQHLPLPSNPVMPSIKVPYLCQEDYDGGPLDEYPKRHGWTLNFRSGNLQILRFESEPPNSEIAAFLQTWLYFGLLHETVGPRYREVSFSRMENGVKYLTTANLEHVVEAWSSDLTSQDSLSDVDNLVQRLRSGRKNIQIVQETTYQIGRTEPDMLHSAFVLTLAALTETLVCVLCDVCKIDSVRAAIGRNTILRLSWRNSADAGRRPYDPRAPLVEFLRKNRWCPSDVKRIDATVEEIGTLHYMTNMSPPRAWSSHERCSENLCSDTKINSSTYRLSHTRPKCQCQLVRAGNSQLCSIIRHGRLAVLDVETAGKNSLEARITVRARNNDEDFIALSHVWSEGLGNPFDNALHACELARIANLTRRLEPAGQSVNPMPIWIDSISVPVKPQEVQQLALERLREPFEQARYVLVLDSYLSEVKAEDINGLEIFARILCSSWMQRLWTLQEGRLSNRLLFQFADKAVDLWEVYRGVSWFSITYWATMIDVIFNYQVSRFCDDTEEYNGDIITTRNNLRSRSVSVASDEALCLTCLMGKDVSRIAHAEANDRMALFWKMQDTVPAGLVFSKASRKLQTLGLRWAPETFLGFTERDRSTDSWYGPNNILDIRAQVINDGLLVRLPGLRRSLNLRDSEAPLDWGGKFMRGSRTGLWYFFEIVGDWTSTNSVLSCSDDRAILLPKTLQLDSEEAPLQSSGFSSLRKCEGLEAIVHSKHIEEDLSALYVRGLRHVAVNSLSEPFQRALNLALRGAREILEEKQLSSWILTQENLEARVTMCEVRRKAENLLKDSVIESLYREWAICLGEESDSVSLVSFLSGIMAGMGAGMDFWTFERTADDQLWCVD